MTRLPLRMMLLPAILEAADRARRKATRILAKQSSKRLEKSPVEIPFKYRKDEMARRVNDSFMKFRHAGRWRKYLRYFMKSCQDFQPMLEITGRSRVGTRLLNQAGAIGLFRA